MHRKPKIAFSNCLIKKMDILKNNIFTSNTTQKCTLEKLKSLN